MARRCVCALIALCALLLSGCMRVSAELRVEDDGSGTFRALIAADRARIGDALVGIDDAAIEAIFPPAATVQAALPAGSTVEPYADGGFDGYIVTAPFAQPADLETILASLQGVVGAPAIGSLVLEPDGEGWRFESSMAAAVDDPVGTARSVLGTLAPGDLTDEQLDQVLEGLVLEFSVHLPGQVVEQNADRVTADGTLVWDLTASDGARTLSARSQPGDAVTGDGAPALVAQTTDDGTGGTTTVDTGTDTDPVDEPTASSGTATSSSDTAVVADGAEPAVASDDEDDGGGGGSAIVLVIVALVVAAAVVALVVALRGRSRRGAPPAPGGPTGWSGPGAGPMPTSAAPTAFGAPAGPPGPAPVDVPSAAADPTWAPSPMPAPSAPSAPASGPEADRWAPPPPPPPPDLGATRVLPAWGTDPDAPPDAPPPPMPTDPSPAGPTGPPAPPRPRG
jgi:hypothetical protein